MSGTTTVTLKGHSFAVQTLQHADTWRTFPAWLAEETGLDALVCDRLGHGQSGPVDRPPGTPTGRWRTAFQKSGARPHREAREVMEREGPAFLRQVLASA